MSISDTSMVDNIIRKDNAMNFFSFLIRLWILSDIIDGHRTVCNADDYYAYDGYDDDYDYEDYDAYDDFDCFDY